MSLSYREFRVERRRFKTIEFYSSELVPQKGLSAVKRLVGLHNKLCPDICRSLLVTPSRYCAAARILNNTPIGRNIIAESSQRRHLDEKNKSNALINYKRCWMLSRRLIKETSVVSLARAAPSLSSLAASSPLEGLWRRRRPSETRFPGQDSNPGAGGSCEGGLGRNC